MGMCAVVAINSDAILWLFAGQTVFFVLAVLFQIITRR